MRRFGCAVELGKKLHENLAKMTCKSKITIGKRGSILPSLEDRIEQAMRYATTSVQKREATPMTQNPEESPIHGSVRKQPETFCCTLIMRRSRSAWLLSKGTSKSKGNWSTAC